MQENIFNRELKIKSSLFMLIILALIGCMIAIGVLINDNPDIVISKDDTLSKDNEGQMDTRTAEKQAEEAVPIDEIKVYVTGEVNNPGVVTIRKGQIVKDAIDMAGGMTENADAENINLAYELKENVMLKIKPKAVDDTGKSESNAVSGNSTGKTVKNTGSTQTNAAGSTAKASTANLKNTGEIKTQSAQVNKSEETYDKTIAGMEIVKDSGGVVVSEKEEKEKGTGKININTALVQELDALPGIGPATAEKIITYREKVGGFKKIEDIMEVPGIGESKFNSLKDYIVTE